MVDIDPEYNPDSTPEPEDLVRLPEAVVAELKNAMFTTANVKDAAFIPVVIDLSTENPQFGYDLDGNILSEEDVRDAAYSFKLRAVGVEEAGVGYGMCGMQAIARIANMPFVVAFTNNGGSIMIMFPTRKEIESGDISGFNPGGPAPL